MWPEEEIDTGDDGAGDETGDSGKGGDGEKSSAKGGDGEKSSAKGGGGRVDARITALTAERRQLHTQLGAARSDLDAAHRELAELTKERDALKAERAQLDQERALLQVGVTDADDATVIATFYGRVQAGADGKKPPLAEWLKSETLPKPVAAIIAGAGGGGAGAGTGGQTKVPAGNAGTRTATGATGSKGSGVPKDPASYKKWKEGGGLR